mmetsp:Transcript_11604/g.24419  ORF Transcript_11604/g.24419 Transcript_11604/m.24419 type:complete len:105 (-) Transcript_11604:230-544(-)
MPTLAPIPEPASPQPPVIVGLAPTPKGEAVPIHPQPHTPTHMAEHISGPMSPPTVLGKRAATGDATTDGSSMSPVKRPRLFIEDCCEHKDKKPKKTSSNLIYRS